MGHCGFTNRQASRRFKLKYIGTLCTTVRAAAVAALYSATKLTRKTIDGKAVLSFHVYIHIHT